MSKTIYSQPPSFTEGYLNRTQLASYLGVSRSTITNLMKKGALPPPTRIGIRTMRWKRSVVDAYLKEKAGE